MKSGDFGGPSGYCRSIGKQLSMPKLILLIFNDFLLHAPHALLYKSIVCGIVCKANSCRIQFDCEGTQSSAADLSVRGQIQIVVLKILKVGFLTLI